MNISKTGRFCFYWFLISVPAALNVDMYAAHLNGISNIIFYSGFLCGIVSPLLCNRGIGRRIIMLIVTMVVILLYMLLWSIILSIMGAPFCAR